jgi:hypothetical protein
MFAEPLAGFRQATARSRRTEDGSRANRLQGNIRGVRLAH